MNGIEAGHLTERQLREYIRNELTPQERDQVDLELETCEGCLWLFMAVMEEAELVDTPLLPDAELPDMARMEEAVMAKLMQVVDSGEAMRAPHFAEVVPSQASDRVSHVRLEKAELQQQLEQPELAGNTELELAEIESEKETKDVRKRSPRQRGSWLQHPVTHYTIAASITVLLLASGALTSFSDSLQQLNENDRSHISPYSVGAEWTKEPSWSDRLVHQAGNWLDGVQSWRFK